MTHALPIATTQSDDAVASVDTAYRGRPTSVITERHFRAAEIVARES